MRCFVHSVLLILRVSPLPQAVPLTVANGTFDETAIRLAKWILNPKPLNLLAMLEVFAKQGRAPRFQCRADDE